MNDAHAPPLRFSDGENLRIVADDRELQGGVIAELQARADVHVQTERLGIGDFLVGSEVLVERKTIADFAQSIVDTRLFRQASVMIQGARRPVLILEGSSGAVAEARVSRDAFQGALITMSLFFGIPVLRARDAGETARLLVYIGRQSEHVARGAWHRPGYRPKGKRARELFILQGLPGVGRERAGLLLDHFGSVQAVVNASVEDLTIVHGVGVDTARKIYWALPSETSAKTPC